jgi:acetoin utilization deacetylase AcuC-like enzyme
LNNIAIAAKHAIMTGRAKRVFIMDWDIHHGNGIQDLTYDDPSIFYMSIHRGGGGARTYFYPGTGRPTEVGAAGTNLNIAWNVSGMGDEEYTAAFTQMVIPALQHFRADLIIVACGLDAAQGDYIGDCGLTEDMFYHMTRMLIDATTTENNTNTNNKDKDTAVPIVVALEGGYNIETSANCMEKIALALLDEPLLLMVEEENEQEQPGDSSTAKKVKKARRYASSNPDAHTAAMRSIQRSAQALQREGGTCVSGCHYKCKHVSAHHALPLKKRRSYKKVVGN